ncbi:SpoIID/LytB domain-containing protein [Clostridium sp. AN503]|uniref:SpoIID/LytB domain-containing protein n=1 Tax=Clostridium sp. AN503 TaxID=3160598 RepID=UPI003459AFB2
MRKWVVSGIIILLLPWLMSLVWMHQGGQAVSPVKEIQAGLEAENQAAGTLINGSGDAAGVAGDTVVEAGEAEVEKTAGALEAAVEGLAAGVRGAGDGSHGTVTRKILLERNGIRTYLALEDYLPGVIVCQMNPEYSPEALKCQAVIARTYIYRLMNGRTEIHEEELDLDYLGEEAGVRPGSTSLAEKELAAENLGRCRKAVQETAGIVMRYEDRYVLPLFHAISAGRTRKGEADYPYLQPVDSRWDTSRADYKCTLEWSRAEFAGLVNQIPDGQPVSADQLPDQIQTVKKDDSEYVLQMKIGAKTYTGEEIQYALGLPSSCFLLEGDGDRIRAVSRGSGHGYGLSQAGADSMARDGWGYEDILNYYYKNISLTAE